MTPYSYTSEFGEFTNSAGVPWTVRVVFGGGRYGCEDCRTHDESDPLIEFYDARYEHTAERGQFVARYYASTLRGGKYTRPFGTGYGLNLQDDVPAWSLDAATCTRISHWLADNLHI